MERITTNGFPKHGNHPLVKACQLLGVPCAVSHIPFGGQVEAKHLFIKRDPRNALIAWLRMFGQPETAGMFITTFRQYQNSPLVGQMAAYEGWLQDADTYQVRYEDLIASRVTMEGIAGYLGIPYLEGAFEELPGVTLTWTGPNHSDYRTIWTPEVETVWAAEGGPELLDRWGY